MRADAVTGTLLVTNWDWTHLLRLATDGWTTLQHASWTLGCDRVNLSLGTRLPGGVKSVHMAALALEREGTTRCP